MYIDSNYYRRISSYSFSVVFLLNQVIESKGKHNPDEAVRVSVLVGIHSSSSLEASHYCI